jgi:hypothetical protein
MSDVPGDAVVSPSRLAELVDHSLLRQMRPPAEPSSVRYVMLETIREYASERVDQMPEAAQVRSAHAAAFLALVETGGRPHAGLARKEWLEQLGTEHNNIRAALSWYRDHDPPLALRLAASMSAFWSLRGHHTEGRQRLGELLTTSSSRPSAARQWSSAGPPAGSVRCTLPIRPDHWRARTVAGAGRDPGSACPTWSSASAVTPHLCTASWVAAGTCWWCPRLTRHTC